MRPGQPVGDGKSITHPSLWTRGICIPPPGSVRSGPSETGDRGRVSARPPPPGRRTGNNRGRLRALCSRLEPRKLPGCPRGVGNTWGRRGDPLSCKACVSNRPAVWAPRRRLPAFPQRKTCWLRARGWGRFSREPPCKVRPQERLRHVEGHGCPPPGPWRSGSSVPE